MASGPRSRSGSGLFLRYAAASLLPVLLLGLFLVRSDQDAGVERGLSQGRAQAAVIEQMAVSPALQGHDLEAGLSSSEREALQRATDLPIFSGSISRLRLRSFTGRVVFSDDGLNTSPLAGGSPEFRAAAAGRAQVQRVDDTDGGVGGQAIRVLQPVIPAASGQAVGVLEITLPYAPIQRLVRRQLHQTYLLLGAGLAVLYVVLALISWSTTSRLRRHAASQEHQALHDTLTGLPNRALYRALADHALQATDADLSTAIVLVDLDRFKQVNDTLGHHAGDLLLQAVAQRLAAAVRTDDTVARLGGDEFGLVLPNVGGSQDAVALLRRVRAELARDVLVDGVPLNVEASFGVALFPSHGDDVEALLRHADAAMYASKRSTAGVVVHHQHDDEPSMPGPVVQRELRQALQADELRLFYQPKIDLGSGRVVGVEALLRWQHPTRGLLTPADFLPAAEQSDLIEPLTAWVVDHALLDHQDWTAAGRNWPVSVNVSARNLSTRSLLSHVTQALVRTGTRGQQLCLEVTETALAADAGAAVQILTDLTTLGVVVSLDDFGTGYTSLQQLRTAPVGEIKIDRVFIADLPGDRHDQAIVRSVIALAHGLGCSVTAEGVETAAAANWLRAAGCDLAQGYLFARPAPWPDLLARCRPDDPLASVSSQLFGQDPQPA